MTATVAATYTDYLTRIRERDPSVLLGSLAWYAVEDRVRVKHTTLIDLINECDDAVAKLILAAAPGAPDDDDVFRRVSSAQARKKVETDNPDILENYLVREVVRSGGRVVKCIVVEQVDRKGEKLSHDEAVKIEYDQGVVTIEALQSPANEQAMNVAELIRLRYLEARGHVDSYVIREMFRKSILATGAMIVRPSGGVYFVMEEYRRLIDGLSKIATDIDGVSFTAVPLLNDADMQSMLHEAIEVETQREMQKTLDEIDKMLNGPEISSAKYQKLYQRMMEVTGRTSEYEVILDDALAGCDLLAKSYKAKMRKLFLHVSEV